MDKALHTTHERATQHGIPHVKQNLHTTTGQSHRGTSGGTVREGRGEVKSEGKEREREGKRGKATQPSCDERNPKGTGQTQPKGTGQTQPKGTEQTQPKGTGQTQPQDRKGEGKPIPIKTNGLHLPSSLSYGSLGLRSVQLGCVAFPLFPSLSLSFPIFPYLSLAFFLFNSSLTYENKEKEDKSGAKLPYHPIVNARCCNFANVKPKQLKRLLLMARTYNRGGLHRYTLRSKRQADKTETQNDMPTSDKQTVANYV